MEDSNNYWVPLLSAISGVIAAIGLPKILQGWFGFLSNRQKSNYANQQEVNNMKLKILKLETAVDMLIVAITHDENSSPSVQAAVSKVKEYLHDESQEVKSN